MKTRLSAAVAVVLLLGAGTATAADLASSKLLPPAPALPAFYSWSGAYLGAQLGYSWNSDRTRQVFPTGGIAAFRYNPDSLFGGVQAGFNYQMGALVLGVEADAEALNARSGFTAPTSVGRSRRDWQASVRGRLGYAFDTMMIYGTGGAAFTEFDHRFTDPATGSGESVQSSRTGWTVGGGINYALSANLILGVEYRYTDYGKFSHVGTVALPGLVSEQDAKTHAARASIAYKF